MYYLCLTLLIQELRNTTNKVQLPTSFPIHLYSVCLKEFHLTDSFIAGKPIPPHTHTPTNTQTLTRTHTHTQTQFPKVHATSAATASLLGPVTALEPTSLDHLRPPAKNLQGQRKSKTCNLPATSPRRTRSIRSILCTHSSILLSETTRLGRQTGVLPWVMQRAQLRELIHSQKSPIKLSCQTRSSYLTSKTSLSSLSFHLPPPLLSPSLSPSPALWALTVDMKKVAPLTPPLPNQKNLDSLRPSHSPCPTLRSVSWPSQSLIFS